MRSRNAALIQPPPSSMFFADGKQRIDFVLVTKDEVLGKLENATRINNFISSLSDNGIKIEMTYGEALNDHVFIKLHAPDDLVNRLALQFKVELSFNNHNYVPESTPVFKFMRTELHRLDRSYLLERNPETIADIRPVNPTNAERSMLVYKLMSETWYDENVEDYGIDRMLDEGYFVAAYPLHEGIASWTESGPLSDRQILAKFWAHLYKIFKKQPLNLVEKYYGTEVAMYFAWMEYYILALVPASLMGIICFCIGYVFTYVVEGQVIESEVCESTKLLCPMCDDESTCSFTNLSESCEFLKLGILFDNYLSLLYAVFMSVWASVFMLMWQRRLNALRLRWNVFKVQLDKNVRAEYLHRATAERINKLTGETEKYVPNSYRCPLRTLTSTIGILILIFIMMLTMSLNVFQNKTAYITNLSDEKIGKERKLKTSIIASLIVSVIIQITSMFHEKIALFLTKSECPRTQWEFDNSYILKLCCLECVNSYAPLVYLAFFKGKFFQHPGVYHKSSTMNSIVYDLCGPSGCFTDLGIQLATILMVPNLKAVLKQFIIPAMNVVRKRKSHKLYRDDLPQCEYDFFLESTDRYHMLGEYTDICIQYGYITCFVAAFPLAPVLALLRNVIEVRVDARKFTRFSQRFTPKKISGLGAYRRVMDGMTYFGIVMNACVIAFSSSFIPRLMHSIHSGHEITGYYDYTLSEFHVADFQKRKSNIENVTVCYYQGMRNPPGHPQKYELKKQFFEMLMVQFAFVFVFEQVVKLFRGIMLSAVKDVPLKVRRQLEFQESLFQEARTEILNDMYKKQIKKFSDSVRVPTHK